MVEQWGLLGPETISFPRRTRSLGLAASVRRFNDLAVPGLGSVWFGKQIFLALLGVAVAEYVRARGKDFQNLQVANAVEALACWLAYRENNWASDPRLRGITKLKEVNELDKFTFQQARQRRFYVTQPMRMATVQALPALGLVEADNTRFNSFRCSDAGRELIDAVTQKAALSTVRREHSLWAEDNSIVQLLVSWVLRTGGITRRAPSLLSVLSPLSPLPEAARDILRHRLLYGGRGAERRRAAWSWISSLEGRAKASWKSKPQQILSDHWHDLQAGAYFFALYDAAITVLDAMESCMGARTELSLSLSEALPCDLEPLRQAAQQYLAIEKYGDATDDDASAFARACLGRKNDIVRMLVQRDGQVLQLRGERIVPGPAFRGTPQRQGHNADEDDAPRSGAVLLPPHISFRIHNLWLLYHDLKGDLEGLVLPKRAEGKA